MKKRKVMDRKILHREGEPCEHIGCLSHVTHPCEKCGRIAGRGNHYEPMFEIPEEYQRKRNKMNKSEIKKQLIKPPVMIGGCGRSGTTLLASILSAHPSIAMIPHETRAFSISAKFIRENKGPKELGWDKLTKKNKRIYNKLKQIDIKETHTRWGEKSPYNVLYFDKILKYFDNNVRLIHIVRDGRDVQSSRHPYAPDRFWNELSRWEINVSCGLKFLNHPQVLTIKYEDLILKFNDTITTICDFIEEDVCKEMLEWHKYTAYGKKCKNLNSNKYENKLSTSSIRKWESTEDEEIKNRVKEFMECPKSVELLKKLGYKI